VQRSPEALCVFVISVLVLYMCSVSFWFLGSELCFLGFAYGTVVLSSISRV
jgi:hypothetical protein